MQLEETINKLKLKIREYGQSKLARELKISRFWLTRFCTGKANMSVKMMMKIQRYFDKIEEEKNDGQ